jgi:hypothetical protein
MADVDNNFKEGISQEKLSELINKSVYFVRLLEIPLMVLVQVLS